MRKGFLYVVVLSCLAIIFIPHLYAAKGKKYLVILG